MITLYRFSAESSECFYHFCMGCCWKINGTEFTHDSSFPTSDVLWITKCRKMLKVMALGLIRG